jgi:hypothetical protein
MTSAAVLVTAALLLPGIAHARGTNLTDETHRDSGSAALVRQRF